MDVVIYIRFLRWVILLILLYMPVAFLILLPVNCKDSFFRADAWFFFFFFDFFV